MELVHRLLQELAREGVAILLSTHHLQEVARYAHRVGILGGGRLLDEVVLSGKEAYRLEAEPLEGALALLKTLPQVASARLQGRSVVFEGEPEAALRALLAEGYRVRALAPTALTSWTTTRRGCGMFRLVRFEVYKLFRLRSVRLGLLFALLLPFLWALAPGLKEAYGLVLASGWQVVSLSLLAGMEFLFPFLVVVAASETLGSEVAQGTLKSLLLRPLSRTHLLLAKLFAVLLYPFVLLGRASSGVLAGMPYGLGAFYGGTGLGEGGSPGRGF